MSDIVQSAAIETDAVTAPRWQDITRFLFVLGQLGLVAIAIRQFQIESSAFLRVFLLAVGGFAVHYFLPDRYRMPFFVLLSLAGILMIMGLETGIALISIGMVLIGICHIPIPWLWRGLLLLSAAAILATLRTDIVPLPFSDALWPILGSIFMFRLIVYVYDFRHEKTPPDFWSSLGYFFMLPNVCFPLFPVVDYKTFRRQHMDRSLFEISNQGVSWIVRGVLHLVLYRVVYYYFTIAPHEVVDADSLVQFLVANFMLYLRISGHFHLIIGILYLFGFRLPETHHRYMLSSSFTEFWRRINIYWKDFMMKVLYMPLYFRLRRLGGTAALIIATALVFTGTWAAHSYQWFWLRGSFPIVWQDILFWSVLAVLVIINSLVEIKWGRKRSLQSAWTLREQALLGIKTVATFTAIVLLWSIWTSESFESWWSMFHFIAKPNGEGGGFPLYFVVMCVVIFACAIFFGKQTKGADSRSKKLFSVLGVDITGSGARTLGMLLVLALTGLPQVYTQFNTDTANLILSLRGNTLSRVDAAELQRGYYEDLTRVDRFNSKLWEVYMKKPTGWLDVTGSGLTRLTDDFTGTELIPSFRATTSFSVITTNRWGMRDQDYDQAPAPGTYRFAMLGASNVMGWGVEDDETFESLLERAMNNGLSNGRFTRVESLNLGVPGYYPLQQLPVLERSFEFSPHAFLYIATGRELSRGAYYLAEYALKKGSLPYPALDKIAREANLAQADDMSDARRRLAPYQSRIAEWLYTELAERAIAQGVHPIFVFLPQLQRGDWEEETPETFALARSAGMHIVDLSTLYDGVEGNLQIAEWDNHPNARAHAMIAERLYREITALWPKLQQIPGT